MTGLLSGVAKGFKEGLNRGWYAGQGKTFEVSDPQPGVYFLIKMEGKTGTVGSFEPHEAKATKVVLKELEAIVLDNRTY
ncbi:MAG TPA: hypothetical protein VMR41_03510 [Patescibacteria group bacterium]|nr:hypothetical protein [Patescibacteria group bacterium]